MSSANDDLVLAGGSAILDYTVTQTIGKGSYGIVYSAYTPQYPGMSVALKIVKNQPAYRRQATMESNVLVQLHTTYGADPRLLHVVRHLTTFDFHGHVCLVFELLSHTLFAEYRAIPRGMGTGLPVQRVRDACYHTLCALSMLEEINIMHCDVKPENVMAVHPTSPQPQLSHDTLSSTGIVRLIDFGAVRSTLKNDYYDVQSLWYRAPEVLMQIPYSCKIDIWSVGCMAAELWSRCPLFAGNSVAEQLRLIRNLCKDGMTLQNHLNTMASRAAPHPSSALLVDFIMRCLILDPAHRPTSKQLLMHPLFAQTQQQQQKQRLQPPMVPWTVEQDATWSPGSTVDSSQSNNELNEMEYSDDTTLCSAGSSSCSQGSSWGGGDPGLITFLPPSCAAPPMMMMGNPSMPPPPTYRTGRGPMLVVPLTIDQTTPQHCYGNSMNPPPGVPYFSPRRLVE
eukprot:PhF_6_TR40448/c2_g1_i1/m.60407